MTIITSTLLNMAKMYGSGVHQSNKDDYIKCCQEVVSNMPSCKVEWLRSSDNITNWISTSTPFQCLLLCEQGRRSWDFMCKDMKFVNLNCPVTDVVSLFCKSDRKVHAIYVDVSIHALTKDINLAQHLQECKNILHVTGVLWGNLYHTRERLLSKFAEEHEMTLITHGSYWMMRETDDTTMFHVDDIN